jgi:hypothetical protein
MLKLVHPQHKVTRQLWKDFELHTAKHRAMVEMHLRVGNFSPEAREELEKLSPKDVADSYAQMRKRAIYVDCVQGPERWSCPDRSIPRGFAAEFMRGILKSIGRIITPAQTASANANAMQRTAPANKKRLDALREWSETPEARELSRLDIEEQASFVQEMDAKLAKLLAEPGARSERAGPSNATPRG